MHPPLLLLLQAGHRVSALMGAVMGHQVPVDSPRLYAALLPPEEAKAQALGSIMRAHLASLAGAGRAGGAGTGAEQGTGAGLRAGAEGKKETGVASCQGDASMPTLHFVDDRLDTLLACLDHPQMTAAGRNHMDGGGEGGGAGEGGLKLPLRRAARAQGEVGGAGRWKLYLASWGYCTQEEVEKARATEGVAVLELPDFIRLMMGGTRLLK